MSCQLAQLHSGELDECLEMDFNSTSDHNLTRDDVYMLLREKMKSVNNVDDKTIVILVGVYSILMVAGLSANISISLVVARRPQMRTAKNLYIVNLTVSDMALCLICMPFTLIAVIRRQWNLGTAMCKLVPAVQGTNIMVSVGTITVIAMDRYLTIVRGCGSADSKTRVIVSIILVWLLSAVATLPVVFYQVVEPFTFQRVVLYETCIEKWPSQQWKVAYAAGVLLIQAVIPAAVVVIVHARIASYLHVHAKTQQDSRRAQRELKRNRRTTILLSCIAIVFAISWLPLGVFSLSVDLMFPPDSIYQVSSQKLYAVLAGCHILAMSSAVSNPVVYGWLNSNIRQELLMLMPSKCARRSEAERSSDPRTRKQKYLFEEQTTRTNLQTANHQDSVTMVTRSNGERQSFRNKRKRNETTVTAL